jgi:hypothetical protein
MSVPNWTRVQGTGNPMAAGSTSVSATFASPVTAGNLIAVAIGNYGQYSTGVTDNLGNQYHLLGRINNNDENSNHVELWYSIPTTGGLITVTSANAQASNLGISEFSCGGVPISVNGQPNFSANQADGTAMSCGNITLAKTPALVIAALADGGAQGAYTAGSGFTLDYASPYVNGSHVGVALEYNLNVTTSPVNATASLSTSGRWAAVSAAFYAGTILYAAPTTVTPYVTKNGMVAFIATDSHAGIPAPVTAVATDPTIQVQFGGGGSPRAVTKVGPFWAPVTHVLPFAMYQVACGPVASVVVQKPGQGYTSPTASWTGGGGSGLVLGTPVVSSGGITSVPVLSPGSGFSSPPTITIIDPTGTGAVVVAQMAGIQPGDVVTYGGVADGWLTSASGIAAGYPSTYISSNTVANYSGQLEPGVGGYTGFNAPASQRTLKVGKEVGDPHSNYGSTYNGHANWFKRNNSGAGFGNVDTVAPDQRPLTLHGVGTFDVADTSVIAMVDNSEYPVAAGVWTLIVDDSNAANPMQWGMYSNRNNATVAVNKIPGVTTGSTIVGTVWQFTVTRTSTVDYNLGLQLTFTVPGQTGSYPYTATNEYLFSPAASAAALPGVPTRVYPGGADQNLLNWMITPKGRGPSVLRYMDSVFGYGGINNIVDESDLQDPNAFSWAQRQVPSAAAIAANPTGIRTFKVLTVRNYSLAVSPNVYTPQWGTPTPGWSGYGKGLAGPFFVTPTSIEYLGVVPGGINNQYVGEAITDVQHNLKMGQQIWWQGGSGQYPININATGGTALHDLANAGTAGFISVYPTGPNSFAFAHYYGQNINGTGLPGNFCNVVGSNPVNYTFMGFGIQPSTMPYEVSAAITNSFPGTNHWVNLPITGTDACYATIAQRIRDNLSPGRKVYVEMSNESWNFTFPSGTQCGAAGMLKLWDPGFQDYHGALAARTSQAHDIFVSVFNQTGRGGEIVRLFAGQFGAPEGGLIEAIAYCAARGKQMDAFTFAYYRDAFYEGATIKFAAAMASQVPQSIAYLDPYPATRAQYFDYYRHMTKYISNVNAPGGYFSTTLDALKTYVPTAAQPAGYVPYLVGYEGGLSSLVDNQVSTGPDAQGFNLGAQLTHDLLFDPNIYDAEITHYQSAEDNGMIELALFHLAGPTYSGLDIWSSITWAGQGIGRGLSNTFWIDTGRAQWLKNASVRMQAFRDQIDGTSPTPTPTPTPTPIPTPTPAVQITATFLITGPSGSGTTTYTWSTATPPSTQ